MTDATARGAHSDQPAKKRKTPRTPAEIAAEPLELRYLRHIRGAVVFMAVIVALSVAGGVIAVVVAHSQSQSSSCLSQGGTNADC